MKLDANPVATLGKTAVLSDDRMEAGRPYPYEVDGTWMLAVKRDDGVVSVYGLDPDRRWMTFAFLALFVGGLVLGLAVGLVLGWST